MIQLKATDLGLSIVIHDLLLLTVCLLTMRRLSLNAIQKSPNENVTRFQYQFGLDDSIYFGNMALIVLFWCCNYIKQELTSIRHY